MQGLTPDLQLLLFGKQAAEPLSPDDREAWLDYSALRSATEPSTHLDDDQLLEAIFEYVQEKDKKRKIWAELEEQLIQPSLISTSPVRHLASRKPRLLKRVLLAAAVVIVAGLLVWRYALPAHQGNATAVTPPSITNEIAPGTTGAQLTLSGGAVKILDSTTAHQSFTDSGATITIQSSGEAVYASHTGNESSAFHTLTTREAQEYAITLSDGTRVRLNSRSSLRYPTQFNGTERVVEITGEAFFEVSQHASKPFRVVARDMQIAVTGTNFNVRAYPRDSSVQTTLQEGIVQILSGNKAITIKPGEQAITSHGTVQVKKVNVDQVTAWKDGRIELENQTVHSLMEQFRYWYNVKVEIGDSVELIPKEATIYRRKTSLNEIIKTFGIIYPHLSFELKDRSIHVRKKSVE